MMRICIRTFIRGYIRVYIRVYIKGVRGVCLCPHHDQPFFDFRLWQNIPHHQATVATP